uniref:Uncharacterized protein LOC103427996 isoform X1 n=1 Tax=Rhizophora mucronata TaxID=61149 RepID=A0A2P2LWE8_RHIMU
MVHIFVNVEPLWPHISLIHHLSPSS